MNILVLHDEIYPNTSANCRVVFRIIDELIKHQDVKVTILGCAQTEEQHVPFYKSCQIIHSPNDCAVKYHNLCKKLGQNKWIRYLITPKAYLYRIFNKRWTPRDIEIIKWIYLHKRQFDVILACSMPEYMVDIASIFSKKIPVVNYYMEPLDHNPQRIKNWIRYDSHAKRVIINTNFYNIYTKLSTADNVNKLVLTEFPGITEHHITNNPSSYFNQQKINLLFTGKFYPDIRNPKYLFQIMQALSKTNIELHIFGGFNGNFDREFINTYFTNNIHNIHYYGMISPEKVYSLLLEADILVNIGNKDPNRFPSKILEYISTGKPIINLYYTQECSAKRILEKYPLHLNILNDEPITKELTDSIADFCNNNKNNEIDFKYIKSVYYKYSPEYVVNIFYQTLKDASSK